jgi:glycosyltransferase involved in cell wall biosynthesis
MESIKNQSYENIEIRSSRDLDCKGQSHCRNAGVKQSTGKYLFFCDADIELYPKCIEIMVESLERNKDRSFVYCDYVLAGDLFGVHKAESWNPPLLEKYNYISTMSMVRRDDFPGFDEKLKRYEDWDLWLTMAKAGLEGLYIPEVLFTAYFKSTDISMGDGKNDLYWKTKVRQKHKLNKLDYTIIMDNNEIIHSTQNNLSNMTHGYYEYICDYESDINHIVNTSNGYYISIVRNDTLFTHGWNQKLSKVLFERPNCSAVGPMTAHVDSFQRVDLLTKYSHLMNEKNIHQAAGKLNNSEKAILAKICSFCFMFKKETFEKIGDFDLTYKTFEGSFQDWIYRGTKLKLFPHIQLGAYVHNYGKIHAKEQNYLFDHDNSVLVEKYGNTVFNNMEFNFNLNLFNLFPNRQ